MAWSDVISRGSGNTEYRLVIEGALDEWVTTSALAGAAGDGRTRRVGLLRSSLSFSERCDPARVELEGDGPSVEVVDVDGLATASFATRANVVARLGALVEPGDSSATVVDGSHSISNNSYVHSGHECWKVTTSTTSTLNITRAQWDTRAIYHYLSDEVGEYPVEVHSRPYSLRGRRVWLYGYGDGETGAGTLLWRGVISQPPSRTRIDRWSLQVDPISALLEQEVATDAETKVGIRGMYFKWDDAFAMYLTERSGTLAWSAGTDYDPVLLTGHYESLQELADAINIELATSLYSALVNAYRAAVFNGQLRIEVIADGVDPRNANVRFAHKDSEGERNEAGSLVFGTSNEGTANFWVSTAVANATYYSNPLGVSVPYGRLGRTRPERVTASVSADASSAPAKRIYLEKNISVVAGESILITGPRLVTLGTGNGPAQLELRVTAVNAANRYVEVDVRQGPNLGPGTEVFFSRAYGTQTDVAGFRDGLTTQSTKFGAGWTANVADSDLADWAAVAANVVDANPYFSNRDFIFTEAVELREAFQHELRLVGAYLVTDSDGKIAIASMRHPTQTDPTATALSHSAILTSNSMPTWALETEGLINVVEFRTGFNPDTKEFEGDIFRFRDPISIAVVGGKRFKMKVEPRSSTTEPVDGDRLAQQIQRVMGIYARPYYTMTVPVAATTWNVRLGHTVLLTSRDIPDTDGTLGVIDKPCLVVGRRWNLSSMQGELTLLATDKRIRGYAPSAQVNPTYTSNTSGSTWDIGTQQNSFSPTGKTDVSYFSVGDKIRLRLKDGNFSSSNITGTIDSIEGTAPGYEMTVTFDSSITWTPSTDYYVHFTWGTGAGNEPTAAMQSYVYVADSGFLLSDDSEANTLGP